MPRLRQIPRAEATPEVAQAYDRLFGDRDPVAEPGTATGTPGNWWTVWANSPDVLSHAQAGFSVFSSRRRKLEPYFREVGLTRAGFATGSKFVFSQHSKGARAVGIPEEKIQAIPAWGVSPLFTEKERAVLAYTDELVLQHGRVQDGTFAALKSYFSDEEIMELTYAVASYGMHAVISRALRLEYDDVDERIVEVPAPGQAGAADIMSAIRSSD
jgi:alkylhydroperoxidase family enzyme